MKGAAALKPQCLWAKGSVQRVAVMRRCGLIREALQFSEEKPESRSVLSEALFREHVLKRE